MDFVKLTQEEFDSILINHSGLKAFDGLVIKKESAGDWYVLTYKETSNNEFDIEVKKIIIV